MPLIAAIYEPRIAAVTILLVDRLGHAFAIPRGRRCTWREVGPLLDRRRVGLPLGAMALLSCSIRSCCAGSLP